MKKTHQNLKLKRNILMKNGGMKIILLKLKNWDKLKIYFKIDKFLKYINLINFWDKQGYFGYVFQVEYKDQIYAMKIEQPEKKTGALKKEWLIMR